MYFYYTHVLDKTANYFDLSINTIHLPQVVDILIFFAVLTQKKDTTEQSTKRSCQKGTYNCRAPYFFFFLAPQPLSKITLRPLSAVTNAFCGDPFSFFHQTLFKYDDSYKEMQREIWMVKKSIRP